MGVAQTLERIAALPGAHELELSGFDSDDERQVDGLAVFLLERFRTQQDVDAFTLLFELTHPMLADSAARIARQLAPSVDPEDLLSAFMARLFCDTSSPDRRPVRRFLGLGWTSMRNDVLDQLRHHKRFLERGRELGGVLSEPDDPAEQAVLEEELAVLRRCGRRLADITSECFLALERRDQQVLIAREILQLSYDRVASLADVDSEQVGMVIRRARQHLVRRIGRRLDTLAEPVDDDELTVLRSTFSSSAGTATHAKQVMRWMGRMLDRSADAARHRLADLVYEMVKVCLVRVPHLAERTLVGKTPRHGTVVAEDIRSLATRLEGIDRHAERSGRGGNGTTGSYPPLDRSALPTSSIDGHDAVEGVDDRAGTASSAIDDARRCLTLLEDLEGSSGRQVVARALVSIHAGQPAEGEEILRSLQTHDLPTITRRNVSRNLTLALLRQDRWLEALAECERAEVRWPDDPVRLMNVLFASARLGDRALFEQHAVRLGTVQRESPDSNVQGWIEGVLVERAAQVDVSPDRLQELIEGRTTPLEHGGSGHE